MAVRLVDIAEQAGVSCMTVSLVLNSRQYHRVSPQTRRRVEKIARELKYHPNQAARQLTGARSGTLGLLMPHSARDYAMQRFKAIDLEAHRHEYRLMASQVSPDGDGLEEALADFEARGVEGLIWMGLQNLPEERMAEVVERFKAVVMIGYPVPPGACCVALDDAPAIREVIAHLVGQGRKKIVVAVDQAEWTGNQAWLSHIEQALEKHGVKLPAGMVWQRRRGRHVEPQPDADTVDQVVRMLAVDRHADAILTTTDIWAAELIRGLRRQGLNVPGDVAVVGKNNSELAAHFDPPITSLDLQPAAIAYQTLELLVQVIQDESLPLDKRSVNVPMKLILRESTG